MSTASTRPRVDVVERLYTEADLAVMPSELPSGPVVYELDNGRLINLVPPGDEHGAIEATLSAAFVTMGQQKHHGKVRTGEVGIVLWRNPDRIVGADIAFIANRSLPIRRSKEGYLESMPDIVVEILSRNDTAAYVKRKTADYLTAGVVQVWIADPVRREVVIHRKDVTPLTFGPDEILTSDDPIPGFEIPVVEIFAE
jgi:Uma2 family endonuclease